MMMLLKQDINLYQLEEEYVPWLSATRLLGIWALVLIILTGIALKQKWAASMQLHNIQQLKANQEEINKQLLNFSKELNTKKNARIVKEELAILQEKIKKTEQEFTLLQKEADKKAYFLSAYLEGLAAQHIKGTYISYFHIQNENKKITFDGLALQPELVPQMIQSWQQSKPLQGKAFQKLQIKKVKGNSPWVEFNLKAE